MDIDEGPAPRGRWVEATRAAGFELAHRPARAAVAAAALLGAGFLNASVLVVPPKKVAILIRKTGEDLPEGQLLATRPGQKGIQYPVVLEGWHFYDAYHWDWRIVDQVEVGEGELGIRVRRFGRSPLESQVLVDDLPTRPSPEALEAARRGVLREVLRPGRYAINTLAEGVLAPVPAIKIPSGHVGVVSLLAGEAPTDPNVFVVPAGQQGIQPNVVSPGTYYVNPYERRLYPVDLRSHRFDGTIQFPSKDGFPITLEGTMEWAVDPRRVPEVFMKYVDTRDLLTCIVEKVILPNARAYSRLEGSKHLARDYISGETRRRFQDEFTKGITASCARQGVLIKSALVRNTSPPQEIALPIREREIAIRLREKYEHEKEREVEQKELAKTRRLEHRTTSLKQAEADVSVATTKAEQAKEVAVIQASRGLEVARRELEAARNDAEAQVARGRASADVVRLADAAEAQGLAETAGAFGGGEGYVRYLRKQRLARALRSVHANTEGAFGELVSSSLRPGSARVAEVRR